MFVGPQGLHTVQQHTSLSAVKLHMAGLRLLCCQSRDKPLIRVRAVPL